MGEDGRAVIDEKKWSVNETWTASYGTGEGRLLKDIPAGSPSPVLPNYVQVDCERLQGDIETVQQFLTRAERDWWQTTLNEIEDMKGELVNVQ